MATIGNRYLSVLQKVLVLFLMGLQCCQMREMRIRQRVLDENKGTISQIIFKSNNSEIERFAILLLLNLRGKSGK
jgi:hypothetical protein